MIISRSVKNGKILVEIIKPTDVKIRDIQILETKTTTVPEGALNFEVEKKLSVLDAFKAFFFVIIIMIAMSLILNFVLGQIASVQNVDIEVVQNSTLGVFLTYSLSSLSFIKINPLI